MRLWLVFLGLLPILLVGSGPGAGASTPALPPQNGLIAVNGPEGVYIVDPSTGTRDLVPKSAEMSDPAWSPDGTLLAVSSVVGESFNVYTLKPDGTERTLVLENAYSPSWSPDGKQLVVERDSYDASNALAIVNSDGTDARTLEVDSAEALEWMSSPAWSPDGKLIAFVAVYAGKTTIELVTPDGKAVSIPKVDLNTPEPALSWSPDSTSLAFDRYVETKNGGHYAAVVLDLATGHESVYAGEQQGAQAPEWSPEGDQIAFLSMSLRPTRPTTTSHSCGGGEPYETHLWAMRPDGTKAHPLVKGEFYGRPSWGRAAESSSAPAPVADQQPAPAPVAEPQPAPAAEVPPAAPEETPGPSVTSEPAPAPVAETTELPAASKGRIAVRGSNGIYLVDSENAAAQKVPGTAAMIAPAWSPDNSLLAVEQVAKAGPSSIYTIRPDGTHPQLVLENASAPSWSSAGDRIFVVRNECSTRCEPEDDEANVLYSIRPNGSDLQRVDAEETDVYNTRELAWRTDGSPISFFQDGSANSAGSFDTSAAEWAPDESRIAFIGALGPTDEEASAHTVTAGLWIVSADGGTPQLLLEGASGRPSWPSQSR